VQNSAIIIDDHGMAAAPETAAVVNTACARITRLGGALLRPAFAIRKGAT
jgi:hypothetical protein